MRRRIGRCVRRHGGNRWRVRVCAQSSVLVDVVVDVHYGCRCMAGGAGAVQAMLAPVVGVWVQIHVVAVAVHVVDLGTPWSVVIIITQITHGCELWDHKMDQAEKEVSREEYHIRDIVCRGSDFFDWREGRRELEREKDLKWVGR